MLDTTLPVHHRTGLTAIGIVRGRPVWPVLGGSGEGDGSPAGDVPVEQALADAIANNGTDGNDPADESPEDTDGDFNADRAKQAIHKKNQEALALRKRLKELEPLAAKAKELEDASKSDLEKLTSDRDGLKSRAETAELNLLKLQVALDKGLNAAQAKRLSGSSQDELEADADELLELFGGKPDPAPKPKVPGKPKPNLRGGGEPDEPAEETDPKKLAELIRRR